jgi:glucokinase
MTYAVGIDIGGTKIAGGLVDDEGRIVREAREATPGDAAQIPEVVAQVAQQVRGDAEVAGIGIGAAGFIGADRSTVLFAPNIRWRDEPLAERVCELTDVPVVVENDASAAAWGEFRFGAGADSDDLLLVTVGTGVGGGIVHRGQLFRGGFGVAGEIGHLRVVPDGLLCGCGRRGCLEQYASGSALVREARLRLDEPSAGPLREAVGDDPDRLTGPLVTQLAQDGDPLCDDLLADLGRWLGEGIASLATVLDPTVVAIGGGVAAAGDHLLDPIRRAFEASLPAHGHRPLADLRLATLGNDAGLVGAADLVRSEPV